MQANIVEVNFLYYSGPDGAIQILKIGRFLGGGYEKIEKPFRCLQYKKEPTLKTVTHHITEKVSIQ